MPPFPSVTTARGRARPGCGAVVTEGKASNRRCRTASRRSRSSCQRCSPAGPRPTVSPLLVAPFRPRGNAVPSALRRRVAPRRDRRVPSLAPSLRGSVGHVGSGASHGVGFGAHLCKQARAQARSLTPLPGETRIFSVFKGRAFFGCHWHAKGRAALPRHRPNARERYFSTGSPRRCPRNRTPHLSSLSKWRPKHVPSEPTPFPASPEHTSPCSVIVSRTPRQIGDDR